MRLLDLAISDTKRVNSFRLFWYHFIYFIKCGVLTIPEDTPDFLHWGSVKLGWWYIYTSDLQPCVRTRTTQASPRNHVMWVLPQNEWSRNLWKQYPNICIFLKLSRWFWCTTSIENYSSNLSESLGNSRNHGSILGRIKMVLGNQ